MKLLGERLVSCSSKRQKSAAISSTEAEYITLIIDTTKAQQIALDDALVTPVNRLKIRKHNHRLSFDFKSNKPTIKVATVSLNHNSLRFKMKNKSLTLNIENFRDMLQICPRLPDSLHLSRTQILWGMYHTKNVDYVYLLWEDLDIQMYSAILPDVLTNQEMLDSKAYKEYYTVATGAVPPKAKTKYKKKTDKPVTSPKSKTASASKGTRLKSKAKVTKPDMKKQHAKKTKAKGLAVLSEVALSKAEQIKLATKRSKKDFHISHASGSGDGVNTQSKVHDEQNQKAFGTDEGTGTIPGVLDVPPYEFESNKELWGDSEDEDDKNDDGDNDDDAESDDHDDDSDDKRIESDSDEIPDLNLTNLDDEETMDDEENDEVLKELYEDVNVNLEKVNAEMTDANQKGIVDNYLASKIKEAVNVAVQMQTNKLKEEAQAKNQEFLNQVDSTMKKIIKDKVKDQVSKMIPKIEKYVTESLGAKLGRDAQDKDEDTSTGSDRGTKRRKSGKDAESSKDSRSKEKKYSSTSKDASQSQHKSFSKDNDEQPIDKEVTKADWFKKPKRPLTPDPDWNLEYLKGGDSSRRYSTSVTKTKAATYELKWIEDLVPKLWSPVVVNYNKHAYLGTSHWGPKSQRFYGYASNLTSSKDVYSKRRIITVTKLTIMKKYDYGHLEEIELTNLTIHEWYDLNVALHQSKRKRLLRTDELYTFSDGTLNDVRTALHDIAAVIRMDYLPTRRWSNLDKKKGSGYGLRYRQTAVSEEVDVESRKNRRDLPRDNPIDSVEVLRRTYGIIVAKVLKHELELS
nr:hypothetical protein [Tanacetum cinerariifolium]